MIDPGFCPDTFDPGFYPDPFHKVFARYHNGEQWTYIISDSDGNLQTDDEISNTALVDASSPNNNDLLIGQPLMWAAAVNRAPHSLSSEIVDNRDQFMDDAGFYPDPFHKVFARYHNGEQWTYIISDSDGNLRTDDEISNTALVEASSPNENDLLTGQPLMWAVAEVNRAPHSLSSENYESSSPKGDWVQGFNSWVRLVDDLIEIQVQPGKNFSTMFFSSEQDHLNAGTRTIPLRTIQAVRLTPARKGIMGALQFTVPGALTQQHRQSAGKVLKLLSAVTKTDPGTSQAHENSVSFDLGQQESFTSFHRLVVERLSQLGQQNAKQTVDKVDYVSQIRELKGLLDDGILTQAEFDSAKQEILKKI
jgi:hypothetical protein